MVSGRVERSRPGSAASVPSVLKRDRALCVLGLWVVAAPCVWLVELVFLLASYKRTQETLSQAGQRTSAALSTVGSAISRKLGDMR